MLNEDEMKELERLEFENYIWVVFIFLAILNIGGDLLDQEYVKTKDKHFQLDANKIFEFTLVVSFFIYIYYLMRNYEVYKNASEDKRQDYLIKLFGSILILIGALCLIYFQFKEDYFEGTPAI